MPDIKTSLRRQTGSLTAQGTMGLRTCEPRTLSRSSTLHARIGIADTGREIEVEINSRDEIVNLIEEAYSDGRNILWLNDVKGSEYGIPLARIAYVEVADDAEPSVGF